MKQILTYSSNLLQGRNNFLLILLLAITSAALPSTANAQSWYWDANDNPTTSSQWEVRGGGTFNSANLGTTGATTYWKGGHNLDTRPKSSFNGITTVNLRWRLIGNSTSIWDAGFWVNFIPTPGSGNMGLVYTYLTRDGNGTKVNVTSKKSNNCTLSESHLFGSSFTNNTVSNSDFIETKLVFNTADSSVQLTVNGVNCGTRNWTKTLFNNNQTTSGCGANNDNFATILGNTSLMQLDYICINSPSCANDANYLGGSGSGGVVTGVSSFFALPVSLIDFKAAASKQNPKACLLEWQTSSESNSSHFDIEWSATGIEWITVGKVNTVGNSSTIQSYQFLHNETSVLNYYRLRHFDDDGSEILSDIRVVSLQEQVITPDINIYPNPSTSDININTTFDSDINFEVLNNQGKVIQSGLFNKHLNLSNLTPGLYHLKLVSESFTTTKKLIVSF